jgi:Mg-chelatase subunit ChlD
MRLTVPPGPAAALLAVALMTGVATSAPAKERLIGTEANLALAANGASVVSVPSALAGAGRLIDGNLDDGWKAEARFDPGDPPVIVVALAKRTRIAEVLLSPRHFEPASRAPSEVELAVSTEDPDGEFVSLGRFRLPEARAVHALSFPPVEAAFLRVTILGVHRAGRSALGEIAVFEPAAGPDAEVATVATDAPSAGEPDVASVAGVGLASVVPGPDTAAVEPPAGEAAPRFLEAASPPRTSVNVAAASRGGFVRGGLNPHRLIDGQSEDFFRFSVAEPDNPLVLSLIQAYMIDRLRLRLPDVDPPFQYLIEASLDGQSWWTAADRRGGAHRGWQELALEGRPLRYLRLTPARSDDSISRSLRVTEIEAFTSDSPATNVARDNQRAIARGGQYPERALDGAIDNPYNYASIQNQPILVRLLQPYRLLEVRLRLWDGDARAYRYLLEGSRDGETWQVLADRRDGEHRGWQIIALDEPALQLLRLSGVAAAAEGGLRVMELEAYTREAPLNVDRNLAARALGGRVVGVDRDGTGGAATDHALLIDGILTGRPWRSAPPPSGATESSVELVFGFHDDLMAAVGGLILHPAGVDAASVRAMPARLAVDVSADSAVAGFAEVARVALEPGPYPFYLPLLPIEARFVRLRLLETADAPSFALAEVEILEADVADRPSLLESFLAGVVSGTERRQADNIARDIHGGEVAASIGLDDDPRRLIDGEADRSAAMLIRSFPAEFDVTFAQGGSYLVDQLNLHFPNPLEVAFRVRISGSPDGSRFEQIGPTYLHTEKAGWHAVRFSPIALSRLKVEILAGHRGKSVRLSELEVIEAAGPTAGRWREIPSHPDLKTGPNLALAALGGRVVGGAPDGRKDWPKVLLIDGQVSDGDGRLTRSHGWSSVTDPVFPVDLIFAFRDQALAQLAAIGINPANRTRDAGDGAFRGTVRDRPKAFEIWVSEQSADGPWQRVGKVHRLRSQPVLQVFPMTESVAARFVRLRFLSNFGGRHLQVGEVEILEAPPLGGYRSILEGVPLDIANPALGGFLVRFTSQADQRQRRAAQVIEPSSGDTDWWSASDARLPQQFTLAFRDFQVAHLDAVTVSVPAGIPHKSRPRVIKLAGSEDESPLRGFRNLGSYWLDPAQQSHRFAFDPPVSARFLQIGVLETADGAPAQLGRISVLEANQAGYPSVLGRLGRAATRLPEASPDAVAAPDPAALEAEREVEPNDAPESANVLRLGGRIAGEVEPQTDIDRFLLDPADAAGRPINLSLTGMPSIRTYLQLQDASGKEIFGYEPAGAQRRMLFTMGLAPEPHLLTLTEPATSIVLLFDDSGSMRDSIADLREAAARYIDDKRDYEELALVKFENSVTILSDFTRLPGALRQAIDNQLQADGGTALYDGIRRALELFRDDKGNRAIILLSDGADRNSRLAYADIWQRLAESGVRLYSIGLGLGLTVFDPTTGTTAIRMLESWARATGGTLIEATSSEELLSAYARISAELRATPRYLIAAGAAEGDGAIAVKQVGERLRGVAVPDQIALVLDASGSMRGRTRDGEAKMRVAQEVMRGLVERLPEDVGVGLRVFGHRQPSEPKARSCEDSELVVPIVAANRAALRREIDKLTPKGQTPIGLSLRRVAQDFADTAGQRFVILVTDGIETCAERPDQADFPVRVVEELERSGLALQVNVVGFDITDSATRAFLSELAVRSGGRYFEAADREQLTRSLREALRARFEILDALDTVIGEGRVDGPPVSVPVGRYRVRVHSEPLLLVPDVDAAADLQTTLLLDKEGEAVGIVRRLDTIEPADGQDGEAAATGPPQARPAPSLGSGVQLVAAVQRALAARGYDPGPADGLMGPATRRAIRRFIEDQGLPLAPEASPALLEALNRTPL